MRGQSEGATSQREGCFHGNSENVENARTCTRNIGLAAVVGLACVVPLLLTISPWVLTGRGIDEFTTIDDLYYSVAVRVSQGQVPYRDFLLEYPIGSLPQIALPILAGRSVPAYRCAYIAEMLLINALMLQVLAWQVGRREGLAAVPRRLAWYFLCYFFLSRMIVSRIDLVPALLAFLATVEWFGSRPIVGGILAGLGGLVKIFPVLVAIPAGLRELCRPRETWLRGSIAFVGSSVLGVALWYLLGGPGLMTSILYHVERGLEIGSLYAGPLMLLGRLTGEPMVAEPGHGSYELQCAMAPAAVAASRYVQLLALVFTLVPFVRSRRRSGVQCAGALILGLILTAPVFSPQFIIWVLPFILVMSGSLGRRARPLYALICVLTFLIYPVFFHRGLIPLWMSAVLLLNLRNSLLIVLWLLMVFGTESVPQPVDLIVNHGDSAGSAHAHEEGKGDSG